MIGKHFSRGRAFTMCHAFVLMGFIALAHVIGPAAQATDARVSDIEKTLSNSLFEGKKGAIHVRAEFHEDGHFAIRGPLGVFHGTWLASSGEICLDFASGPGASFQCAEVLLVAHGQFETNTGVTLHHIASIRRF